MFYSLAVPQCLSDRCLSDRCLSDRYLSHRPWSLRLLSLSSCLAGRRTSLLAVPSCFCVLSDRRPTFASRATLAAYSQEEGTPAANLDDQLDPETKERRRDELIAAFQQHAEEWANRQVGTELRVLVDRVEGEDAIGRTEADAPDIDGSIRLLGCAHLQVSGRSM